MDTPLPRTHAPNHVVLPTSDALTVKYRQAVSETGPSSCILDEDTPSTLSLPVRFEKSARTFPEVIGAYQILREIGCGGMGVVYEGFDPRLKRRAAIKMIRSGATLAQDALRRFQTEAEAVAQTHHPNIVQIYEVGWHDDQPFVALEYLGGGSLYGKAANKPQPPRDAATTVKTLAEAMQHAHASGVIHRDLKPANVLFSDAGVAKITDFGAARLTAGQVPGSAVTQVGEVIGTPQYMAPEQARGAPESITPAVDVYALGALLYHLLTGRPPHDGADSYQVLSAVLTNDPVPPRRLVPNLPRDLETICLKALEKHPLNRYRDAAAMSDDLQRYLNGESIAARPDPGVVRLLKKARRRPVIAGLVVGIVAVAIIGFVGVLWQWKKAETAADIAEREALRAQQEASAAVEARQQAEESLTRHKRAVYHSNVPSVALLQQNGESVRAQLMLGEAEPKPGQRDFRHFEWHHLDRLSFVRSWRSPLDAAEESNWAGAMAVHPSGKFVAISAGYPYRSPDHNWELFQPTQLFFINLATGVLESTWTDCEKEKIITMKWLNDDELLVVPYTLAPKVYQFSTRKVVRSWPLPRPKENSYDDFQRTVVCPNGRMIARQESPRTFIVYDTRTGAKLWTRTVPAGEHIQRAEELTDAGQLTVRGEPRFAILEMPTGRVIVDRLQRLHTIIADTAGQRFYLRTVQGHESNLECLDGNGRTVWQQLDPRPWNDYGYFKLTPDGETLIELGYLSFFRVKRARDGQHLTEVKAHRGIIWHAVITPDGRDLITCGNETTVRVWRILTGQEVAQFRGHSTGVRTVAVAPNGWQIITGGMDGSAMAWDYTRERSDGTDLPPIPGMDRSGGGAFAGGVWATDPHCAYYVDTSQRRILSFDPHTYTPHRIVELESMTPRSEKSGSDFGLSTDGLHLVGPRGVLGPLCLWDTVTGAKLREFGPDDCRVIAAAIAPDGSTVAASFVRLKDKKPVGRTFFVWDAKTGRCITQRELKDYSFSSMAFRPGTRELHLGVFSGPTQENGISVLHLDRPEELVASPAGHPTFIRQIVFSCDGRYRLYFDLHSINEMGRFGKQDLLEPSRSWEKGVFTPLTGIAISHDCQRVATSRHDDNVTIYDAEDGGEILAKQMPGNRVGDYAFPSRVAFGPDNRSLISNSSSGALSVWLTDNWDSDRDWIDHKAIRYREGQSAEWGFHYRAAWQSRWQSDGTSYQFHSKRLNVLTPPNDYLKREWANLKMLVEILALKVVL